MKRYYIFFILFTATLWCSAQVEKTITLSAGALQQSIGTIEQNTITHLTLLGSIDARDFRFMRDSMPALQFADLIHTNIISYSGSAGTIPIDTLYPSDAIPQQAFIRHSTLQSVHLPQSITSIEKYSFAGCTALQQLFIPHSVTKIGARAFEKCRQLSYLIIPQAVTVIEEGTFVACLELDSISISKNIRAIKANAFEACEQLQSFPFGDSLKEIAMNAFFNCKSLKNILLPAKIEQIGRFAFYNCANVSSITCLSPTPLNESNFNAGVFKSIDTNRCVFYVPFGSAAVYKKTAPWKSFLQITERFGFSISTNKMIAKGETSIDTFRIAANEGWNISVEQAWVHLSKKTGRNNDTIIVTMKENNSVRRFSTISISDSLGVVQNITIAQDSTPLRVTLQAGELHALLSDSLLSSTTHIILQGTIDARDFKTLRDEMPELQIINLSQANIVAYNGTEGTSGNKYDSYPPNSIPQDALLGKVMLRTCTIPTSVVSIGEQAFEGCLHLNEMLVPASVNHIGAWAFAYCNGLNKLTCLNQTPLTDTAIGTNVFYHANTSSCALFVPYRSLSDYSDAKQWRAFLNIRPLPGFSVMPSAISLSGEASSMELLYVSANETWFANSNSDWLQINKSTGEHTDTIRISVRRNVSYPRVAKISISANNVPSQDIIIRQGTIPLIVYSDAGMLAQRINRDELVSALNLVVIGSVDARDFKTMRDSMLLLQTINLVDARIVAYTGENGTDGTGNISYPDDYTPSHALYNKKTIKHIELPASSKHIGTYSFAGCDSLTQCSIPLSTNTIESYSFASCFALPEVNITQSVTKIEESAFENCSHLQTLYLPLSVSEIGNRAFAQCPLLRSITVEHTQPIAAPNMGVDVFSGVVYDNCVLHIPYRTTDIYKQANQWKNFIHSKEDFAYTIVLYPNPTTDYFSVLCEGWFEVLVYNTAGELLLKQMATRSNYIWLSPFQRGLFYVRVNSPIQQACFTVVKQ